MCVFIEQFNIGSNHDLVCAVKDNIDISGYVSRAGSAALINEAPADKHADVVENLLASNTTLIGKLNMHELAFGMTGVNQHFGTPINPLFPDYITGGSSSGCAVVVANHSVDFSIGTDTGGSIRVPAACCGVYGLKPTFGRLSRRGISPAHSSLDCVGPMATSASMLISAMQRIDKTFKTQSSQGQIKLGYIDVTANDAIKTQLDKALDKEFISVIRNASHRLLPSLTQAFDAAMLLINAEMWQSFGYLAEHQQLGADIAQRLKAAKNIEDNLLAAAEHVRAIFTHEVDMALKNVDALVLPTLAQFPLSRADALAGKNDLNISSLTRPFNLSGHPAISIPISNGSAKPMAMQLIGAKGNDELLCEIALRITE